ncbi:type II toxin-antitoxin system VapC family toxin [Nocardia stercoris]|uniref:Type II toxin-antitoxin system VapC family toxin n=1 Tax=Nocardia stercoris TaxID=2483361 RepID=A0A3M2LDL3_9NOCA|nr:type II toxin-antitoxin system VapC family toxin [Nocardia stercoris]RMI35494.1 type II toxin-antitoxin system VapC family toxin [Nocardia stercoris]
MTESAAAPFRCPVGLLDTCVLIDIDSIDDVKLPLQGRISSVTMAEIGLGIAVAATPEDLALRTEQMFGIEHTFDPLPFTTAAARRFTSMAKLVVATGRNPKPRKVDLMIAAVASVNDIPLFTRNPDDFKGIENLLTVYAV